MATAADVAATITEVSSVADQILKELAVVPAIGAGAAVADNVLVLVTDLVTKALTAWSTASGVPITPESVAALLPNATPLTAPTE